MLRVEIASILLVIWRASTLAAQTAKPLSSRDLSLAAMPDRADSSVVRRVLGTPDSIANGDDPSEAAPIPAWWYQDLEVIFLHAPRRAVCELGRLALWCVDCTAHPRMPTATPFWYTVSPTGRPYRDACLYGLRAGGYSVFTSVGALTET
jgi:hypothetical protein